MKRRPVTLLPLLWATLTAPQALHGQSVEAGAPVIDTVIIVTQNVFTTEQARKNFAFRLLNGIHITTQPNVIWSELLFRPGEPADSTEWEESERNLRSRELFQAVSIDTLRLADGRLAVIVNTQDGWSLKANLNLTIASDGTWSGRFGATEVNLLGSGNLAHFAYRKELDRQGPELAVDLRRMFQKRLAASGAVVFWNDGTDGKWRLGVTANPHIQVRPNPNLQYATPDPKGHRDPARSSSSSIIPAIVAYGAPRGAGIPFT